MRIHHERIVVVDGPSEMNVRSTALVPGALAGPERIGSFLGTQTIYAPHFPARKFMLAILSGNLAVAYAGRIINREP